MNNKKLYNPTFLKQVIADTMISSLGQFLDSMGVQSRFFDMGRHINEISTHTFQSFEDGAIAYPSPYLHHAWLGLLFWDPEAADTPLLWFLQFPLDEQGKILASERDRFLKQLLSSVGTNIQAVKEGERLNAVLEGNPFTFTPTPERQATMNARMRQLLQQPPSSFYQGARDYLSSDLNNWETLSVQGLADVAVNWPQHQKLLIDAIASMPGTPLDSLCQCLENETINDDIAKAIQNRIEKAITDTSIVDEHSKSVANMIRGISHSSAITLRQKTLQQVLDSEQAKSIEVLAAIATRCSQDLLNPQLCLSFLEALSKQPQQAFNQIMSDLLFLPRLRHSLTVQFQSSQRSDTLVTAIEGLLQQYQR